MSVSLYNLLLKRELGELSRYKLLLSMHLLVKCSLYNEDERIRQKIKICLPSYLKGYLVHCKYLELGIRSRNLKFVYRKWHVHLNKLPYPDEIFKDKVFIKNLETNDVSRELDDPKLPHELIAYYILKNFNKIR